MIVAICGGLLIINDQGGSSVEATPSASTQASNKPTVNATPTPTDGEATNVKTVSVSADKDFAVYVSGQTSNLIFSADAIANGRVTVNYTLRNLSNDNKETGVIDINAGERKATLEKKLDSGVYELTFRPSVGESTGRIMVTVLIDSDLTGGEHFGMDFASFWHLNVGERTKYLEMLKLAGITHIRERIMMSETVSKSGNASLGGYKAKLDALKKNGFSPIITWHDIPEGMTSKKNGNDLSKIYSHMNSLVKLMGEDISAWEIWNEQDVIHFSTMYPDQYAAYLKACAIAIADADKDAVKVLGAFARVPSYSKFGKWMMENGVMDYVDVYNFHVYTFTTYGKGVITDPAAIKEHLDFAGTYGGDIPAWQTETGTVHDEVADIRGNDSLTQQAKYWVITGVESAAMGVERTYPFLFVPYNGEDNLSFFSRDGYAYPAYAAYATMIKMLGKGNLCGKYSSDGVTGYEVRRSNGNAAILWSLKGNKTVTFNASQSIKVTDMYGAVTEIAPKNGKVSIPVSDSPVYITTYPDDMFSDFSVKKDNVEIKTFSAAQKVVLQPHFAAANAPDMPTLETVETNYEGVNSGYRFNKGETAEVVLTVYNFNARTLSGDVSIKLPSGWKCTQASKSITVPSRGSASVTFTVTAPSSISKSTYDTVTFDADFGIGDISESVSKVSGR